MRKLLWLSTSLALVLIGTGVAIWRFDIPHASLQLDESERVEACEAKTKQELKAAETIELLSQIASFCYSEVNEQDTLSEAGIRRLAFLDQQSELPVLMWLVVTITLSGVGLAGIQLLGAYQLAATGRSSFDQGGKVDLEGSKMSIQSSVTGLVILLISLGFFSIFVNQVFLIKETAIRGEVSPTAGDTLQLQPGGIGPPPNVAPKK